MSATINRLADLISRGPAKLASSILEEAFLRGFRWNSAWTIGLPDFDDLAWKDVLELVCLSFGIGESNGVNVFDSGRDFKCIGFCRIGLLLYFMLC